MARRAQSILDVSRLTHDDFISELPGEIYSPRFRSQAGSESQEEDEANICPAR